MKKSKLIPTLTTKPTTHFSPLILILIELFLATSLFPAPAFATPNTHLRQRSAVKGGSAKEIQKHLTAQDGNRKKLQKRLSGLLQEFQKFKHPNYRSAEYQVLLREIETTEEALALRSPSGKFTLTPPEGSSIEIYPYRVPVAPEKATLPFREGLLALADLVAQKQKEVKGPVKLFVTGRPGTGKTTLSHFLLRQGLGAIPPESVQHLRFDEPLVAMNPLGAIDPSAQLVLLDGVSQLIQPDLTLFLEVDEKIRWDRLFRRSLEHIEAYMNHARRDNIRWRYFGVDRYREQADLVMSGDIDQFLDTLEAKDGGDKFLLERDAPELKERPIVEIAAEIAVTDPIFEALEKELRKNPSLSDEDIEERIRWAAMATSVGGIGPVEAEGIIAEGEFGADVSGVTILYDQVYRQVPQPDGTLALELVKVPSELFTVLKEAGRFKMKMYDEDREVEVIIREAPKGSYGKSTVYFLHPQLGPGEVLVAYPGKKDAPGGKEKARLDQSWILGRGTLALFEALNQAPDIMVMNETASMFAHHRLFKDRFSDHPLFKKTRYVYRDHTPLRDAHLRLKGETLQRLKADPAYFEGLPFQMRDWGEVDAAAMLANVADLVLGVSDKHGKVMRDPNEMPLLHQFQDKIDAVTNGVSSRWALEEFRDPEKISSLSNKDLLRIQKAAKQRELLWLAKRQKLSPEWLEWILRENPPLGIWIRRMVEYKQLERLVEILADPSMRKEFLETEIVLIYGGRTHQDDDYGEKQYRSIEEQKRLEEEKRHIQELKKQVQKLMQLDAKEAESQNRKETLKDRIIFFENYNVREAPHLFQMADFSIMLAKNRWEAAATGFMKAQRNGKWIVANLDGAIDQSVKFYDEKIGNEDVANGFYVPYDEYGLPTARGLLDALKQMAKVYRDKEKSGKMVRNALNETTQVSIERMAGEMLPLLAKVLRKAEDEEKPYRSGEEMLDSILKIQKITFSPDQAQGILKQLGNAGAFIWKYSEPVKVFPEVKPGLREFIQKVEEIRHLGTAGLWSLKFHMNRNERGDILTHWAPIFKSIPELAPIGEVLDQWAEDVVTKIPVNDEERRLEANRVAIGFAKALLARLEEMAAPPAETAKDGGDREKEFPRTLSPEEAVKKFRDGIVEPRQRWRRGIPQMSPGDIEQKISEEALIVIEATPGKFMLSRPPQTHSSTVLSSDEALKMLKKPGIQISFSPEGNIKGMTPHDIERAIRDRRIYVMRVGANNLHLYAAHSASDETTPESSADGGKKSDRNQRVQEPVPTKRLSVGDALAALRSSTIKKRYQTTRKVTGTERGKVIRLEDTLHRMTETQILNALSDGKIEVWEMTDGTVRVFLASHKAPPPSEEGEKAAQILSLKPKSLPADDALMLLNDPDIQWVMAGKDLKGVVGQTAQELKDKGWIEQFKGSGGDKWVIHFIQRDKEMEIEEWVQEGVISVTIIQQDPFTILLAPAEKPSPLSKDGGAKNLVQKNLDLLSEASKKNFRQDSVLDNIDHPLLSEPFLQSLEEEGLATPEVKETIELLRKKESLRLQDLFYVIEQVEDAAIQRDPGPERVYHARDFMEGPFRTFIVAIQALPKPKDLVDKLFPEPEQRKGYDYNKDFLVATQNVDSQYQSLVNTLLLQARYGNIDSMEAQSLEAFAPEEFPDHEGLSQLLRSLFALWPAKRLASDPAAISGFVTVLNDLYFIPHGLYLLDNGARRTNYQRTLDDLVVHDVMATELRKVGNEYFQEVFVDVGIDEEPAVDITVITSPLTNHIVIPGTSSRERAERIFAVGRGQKYQFKFEPPSTWPKGGEKAFVKVATKVLRKNFRKGESLEVLIEGLERVEWEYGVIHKAVEMGLAEGLTQYIGDSFAQDRLTYLWGLSRPGAFRRLIGLFGYLLNPVNTNEGMQPTLVSDLLERVHREGLIKQDFRGSDLRNPLVAAKALETLGSMSEEKLRSVSRMILTDQAPTLVTFMDQVTSEGDRDRFARDGGRRRIEAIEPAPIRIYEPAVLEGSI